jgi:signal transduction histidine kinase
LKDFTKPSKRFFGYTASLSKLQVESLAAGLVSLLISDIESVQGDLGMLVHDLRALSNSIYNPAKEAQVFIDRGDIDEARKRIDTVIAAQGILRMRTDALDFSGNAIDPDDKSEIAIFRKVDKVQRCFKTMAYNEGKSVTLSGNSYRKIVGQDFFELVPYTIIDNAVKYSPVGYDISVTVSDQSPETILVVKSYGPKIDENERLAIFTRYFRGREAIETKKPGTGIGLNIAAKIVSDVFSGQISFVQHPGYVEIDGLKYYETDFVVRVPSFL